VEFAPLAVWAGLNDPQDAEGVHVQSTPALAESLATVAATLAVAPGFMLAGGAVPNVMDIAGEVGGAGGAGVLVLVELLEPTAPHPARIAEKTIKMTFARNFARRDICVYSTGVSIEE